MKTPTTVIWKLFLSLVFLAFIQFESTVHAQLAQCDAEVPFFQVNLTGSPDGIWESPSHIRKANCCGTSSPDRCTSFEVILDPNAAMINLEIVSGAVPPGALFYQIDCGPEIPVGDPICIAGVGPHNITFCKPGNNENVYRITSIAQPVFPDDVSTRVGCTVPFRTYGLENITINSINSATGNTTFGAYNTLLSCTDCVEPIFEPGLTTPAWIDYQICGSPLASLCGYIDVCDTVRIFTYSSLGLSVTPDPAFFCAGGPGVELIALPTGGDANYSYIWRNSLGDILNLTATYTATAQGTYSLELIDGLNSPTCPSEFESIPVTVGEPPVVNAGIDQTVCAESPTVFLTGSVDNATGGIWSGATGVFNPSNTNLLTAYTPSHTELLAGSVTLTLTSTGAGGGCVDDNDAVTIFFSDTVFVNPTATPIACYGDETAISANATGGTAPYTYVWSTAETTASINAPAGTYSVMVQDVYGCAKGASVSVTNPSPLLFELSTIEANTPACDGSATVIISGGNAPYSVVWDDPLNQTTLTATGLCVGNYAVTITDANGCVRVGSTVVNDVTCNALSVAIAAKTDVDCYGGDNGTATALVSGGVGPFSYSWNTTPVQTTETANTLSAGTYDVTVTDDATGCQTIATVTIIQPTIITNVMTSIDASSIGGTDGQATANPDGGTPPYQYSWVPSAQTTQTATNLSAGTYYVTIVDDNSCIKTDSVLINQPPCNNFMLAVTTENVSCNGTADGTASLLIAHGTPPYTIIWFDSGMNTIASNVMSVSNLAAGSYTVEVTDNSNCTTFRTFDITEPDALSIGLISSNISCFGSLDGTIDLTVNGGTYPYSFAWYTGVKLISDSEDLINLGTGTYSIIVTDANGCQISGEVGITQPTKLTSTASKTDITCFGFDNGSIDASVSGGTPVYTYSWNGPAGFTASTQDLVDLGPGLYQLQVTDGNGCNLASLREVYINEPSEMIIDSIFVPCPVAGASTITVEVITVTGGDEGPYEISFNNGTTFQAVGNYSATLPIGAVYNVVARDGNGCLTTAPFVLDLNGSVVIDSIVFNPCIPAAAATIPVQVYPSGGDGTTYQVSLDGGATFEAAGVYLFNLPVGQVYDIVVIDASNCASVTSTITIPNELIATAALQNEVSCIGESDGSATLDVTGGTTPYTYSWTGPLGYTSINQNISGLIEGTYNVTVTDDFGCEAISSVVITTFPDVTAPVISCPTNSVTNNDLGVCGAVFAYTTPIGTDDCPGAVTTLTQGLASGSNFPVGITTVEYQVEDLAGNTTTCSFTVEVIDIELPTITCPATVNAVADLNECSIDAVSVNLGTPLTGDNCGVATVSNNAPTSYPVGTTTVTWTVTDIHGNSQSCEQLVIVEDTQAPIISSCGVIGNITVTADAGVCTYTHSSAAWDVVATDNCTTITVEYTLSGSTSGSGTTLDGVTFNPGTTNVLWTVTDNAGNTSTCNFNVTIEDTEDPVFTFCLATNPTVEADLGVCTYTVSGTAWDATATDNCGIVIVTAELSGATIATGLTTLNNVVFNLGTTTVVWTAEDNAGNLVTCSYTITVEDTQDPIISSCGVIGSLTVVSDAGVCTYTNTGLGWDVVATDNCTTTTVAYVLTGATTGTGTTLNGVAFNLGTTTVTWTVTDGSGNTSVCAFDIIVEDTQDPIISSCGVIGSLTVVSDAGVCSYTNTGLGWDVVATDNCTTTTVAYVLTGATTGTGTTLNGVAFNLGTTTVTWTVTDGSGNTSVCTFDIIVEDTQDPIISSCGVIGSLTVVSDAGVCTYTNTGLGWDVVATDNCTTTTVAYVLTGATTGTGTTLNGVAFNLGTTTVTWTVTDGSGNTSVCTFDIIVEDTQDPIISSCGVIGSLTVVSDAGVCTYTNTGLGLDVVATDNCTTTTVAYELTGATTGTGTTLNGVAFNLGTTTVTWTVTDGSGNTSVCTFDIIVEDTQDPIISSCGVIGSLTVVSDAGVCTYTNTGLGWDVVATDNCTTITVAYVLTGATTGTGTTLNGVAFNLGTTTVTWTVTDGSGNTSVCSYQIIVEDDELPVIVGCPTPITAVTDLGECGAVVSWIAPTFTDNCVGASMTSTHNSGDFFPVGSTTVTYTVTDGSGNIATCSFDITVTDTELPVLLCPTDIATCDPVVTFSAPTATDNCGVVSVTQTAGLASGSTFPVGTTTITYEAVDINGNVNTCSFDVIIHPLPVGSTIATDISCNGLGDGQIDLTVSNGTAPFTFLWNNGETSEDLTSLEAGVYDVVITDANGCTGTASATIAEPAVLIVEGTAVQVSCNGGSDGAIDVSVSGGIAPYSYAWSNGEITQDIAALTAGTYSVVVTDANGCTASFGTTITEPDTLNVTFASNPATCNAANGSVVTAVTGGTAPYTYNWSNGAITSNLNSAVAGVYELVVTDANGCTYTLEVEVGSVSNLTAQVYTEDVTCNGRNNGSAIVVVDTGNGPYMYQWSHGPTTASVTGLAEGSYEVTVTDAFGCEVTLQVDIYQPDVLEVELTSPDLGNGFNVTPYGGSNGSVSADAFGGTAPYSFVWSNGSTNQNVGNLTAGDYSVTVTDANGCLAQVSIELLQPMVLEMPNGYSPNNDGKNDYFVVRGLEAYPSNEITIFNRWGNVVYQMNNYDNSWNGFNNKGEPLPDATYFVLLDVHSGDGTITLKGYVDLRR
jgi:gliding motility-associated-like protein